MAIFTDNAEMLKFARDLINGRLIALKKDVNHCIETKPFAPFPAVGICFSVINLLGSLAFRKREGHTLDSTYQSASYMLTYMKYGPRNTKLAIEIFRHGVVHLAMPYPFYTEETGKRFTWKYEHFNTPKHLQITQLPPNSTIPLTPSFSIPCGYEFNLSIERLVDDISVSVDDDKGNGYLSDLHKSEELQTIFREATEELFRPDKPARMLAADTSRLGPSSS